MFLHMFGVATLGKPALALGIIASAYGAGTALATSEYRAPNPPARETARPQTTPKPTPAAVTATTTLSFDALLSECVARYKRGATNTKEACDRAIAASGLSTDAFVAKYRSLLVPPAKTEAPKPTMTPKPTTAPKLNTADPKVRECLAKYEALKTLKTGDPQTFEAALSTFNQTCKTVLGTRG